MTAPRDPLYELATSESVTTPNRVPVGKETAALIAVGAGVGAAVAGPPGALVGGTVGWALDAVLRKLLA